MKKLIKFVFLFLVLFFVFKNQAWGLMASVFEVEDVKEENRPVFAGDVWRQSFVSPQEEFGAVGIKVSNNNRLNDDFWIFRIKEEGQKDWYFETRKYVTDFQDEVFYPIGFPKFSNAKGKKFVFEIESEKGAEANQASIFLTLEDEYLEGEASINGKKTKGDLVFSIYKETPAKELIKESIIQKLKKDPIFFFFWILILIPFIALLN